MTPVTTKTTTRIVEVRGVTKTFRSQRRTALAVDDVSLSVFEGETVGIVGESGCGKSTLARVLTGLLAPDSGEVLLEGISLRPHHRSLDSRRNIQMIFQDPYSALNPKASIGESIGFPLRVHGHPRRDVAGRVSELLDQVGLHPNHASYYPHQLSGGQRQRVNIARALALNPKLVVCDEAVSALDKSIQAQILNLLQSLQEQHGLSYLFISHDLNVVEYMSDHVAVMYLGRIVEQCPSGDLYREPLHPYTQALLASVPQLEGRTEVPALLDGELPSPFDPPSGCRFRTRCPHAMDVCAEVAPPLNEALPGHWVACHLRTTE